MLYGYSYLLVFTVGVMHDVYRLLNTLKTSLIANRYTVKFKPKSLKNCLNFLRILYYEGYILNYIYDSKTNCIYITHNYYKDRATLRVISTYNKVVNPIYLKYRDIAAIHKFGIELLILSTTKGIMPHYKALKLRLGGKAICYLR